MPVQPKQPQSLTGDKTRKTGAGFIRRPSDVTGPKIVTPKINQSAQSARSAAAEKQSSSSNGLGENAHEIPRDEVTQKANYGIT